MRTLVYSLLLTGALLLLPLGSAEAENVTSAEAHRIAQNWLTMIARYTGGWGDQVGAEVITVIEFRSNDRLLGYYCPIEPSGFVLVSPVKGMAPVKSYSEISQLDLDAENGPTALMKLQIERIVRELERQLGPVDELTPEAVERAMVYKNLSRLKTLSLPTEEFLFQLPAVADKRDYLQEDSLLSSHWHQFYPYNLQVPLGHSGCTEDNCAVGCVATAAAQIMRYWSWPPGSDWLSMPDYADANSELATMNDVAYLCSSIGSAVGMDYCSNNCESSVPTADMVPVYDEWHYAEPIVEYRDEYGSEEWWQMVKAHINVNEPIQYRIVGHSIVLDGWREWLHGEYIPEYHMNYGWDNGYTAWYELDGLHQVDPDGSWEYEYMIRNIVPGLSLHSSVGGPLIKLSFPYRYVNRDCTAGAAEFYPGQFIQFLPGVTLVCTRSWMKFSGMPDDNSYLYTPEPSRGIRIQNATMVFYPGAGIRFQQSRPGP